MRYVGTVLYVWAMLFCTVGAYLWQPYTGKGPPGTYVEPVVWGPKLYLDRAPTAPIEPMRVATVSYRYDPPVQKAAISVVHEKSTLPWSCETIRHAVSGLSQKQMDRLARLYRLTEQQKADARRCLKEKRT